MDTEFVCHALGPRSRCLIFAWLVLTIAGCETNSTGALRFLPNSRSFEGEIVDKISCQALAFSPKGDLLFAGGSSFMIRGCRVRILDPSLDHAVRSLPVPVSTGCDFLPDRTTFFMGSTFGDVLRCDAASGSVLNQIRGHNETISDLAISHDGRWLATAAEDGTVALRDPTTLVTLHDLSAKGETVCSVAFTSDSQKLLAGTSEGMINIWTLAEAPRIVDRIPNEVPVDEMLLSPDDSMVFASGNKCCDPGFTKIWSVDSGKLLKTLPRQQQIAFAPDGQSLALAASLNATVTIHDPKTLKERFRIAEYETKPNSTVHVDPAIAFSPDSQTLAIGVEGVRLIRVFDGADSGRLQGLSRYIRTVQFSPSGHTIAAANGDGDLVVWNRESLSVAHKREHLFPQIAMLRLVGDTEQILVCDRAYDEMICGVVQAVDPTTKKIQRSFKGHTRPVCSVAVSPDGTQICTSSADRTVRLWDISSRREIKSLPEQKGTVFAVAYSPDGSMIAAAGHQISLWNAALTEHLLELQKSSGLQYCVRFSPDQSLIAAGGQDGIVRIWRIPEGALLWSSRNLGYPIRALAFFPTGNHLLAAGGEGLSGSASVFGVESGEEGPSLNVPKGAVTCAEISANGDEVYMSGMDRIVRIWNPKTGKTVAQSHVLEGPVAAITVNREDSLIVAAGLMGCRWFKR